jgi:hypothetical protein
MVCAAEDAVSSAVVMVKTFSVFSPPVRVTASLLPTPFTVSLLSKTLTMPLFAVALRSALSAVGSSESLTSLSVAVPVLEDATVPLLPATSISLTPPVSLAMSRSPLTETMSLFPNTLMSSESP